jgi:hypothetical protein
MMFFGKEMLDNNNGTRGIKNLASWCWNTLSTAIPETAERSGSWRGHVHEVKSEISAGPRS